MSKGNNETFIRRKFTYHVQRENVVQKIANKLIFEKKKLVQFIIDLKGHAFIQACIYLCENASHIRNYIYNYVLLLKILLYILKPIMVSTAETKFLYWHNFDYSNSEKSDAKLHNALQKPNIFVRKSYHPEHIIWTFNKWANIHKCKGTMWVVVFQVFKQFIVTPNFLPQTTKPNLFSHSVKDFKRILVRLYIM